jgi:hypothetical protein
MEENVDMVRATLGALLTHREHYLDEVAALQGRAAVTELAFG